MVDLTFEKWRSVSLSVPVHLFRILNEKLEKGIPGPSDVNLIIESPRHQKSSIVKRYCYG